MNRHAMHPLIATVLIIAITLIAAVAIGGFVFGIFGTSSQSAQVTVADENLYAINFSQKGNTTNAICGQTATGGENYLKLVNVGTASATATGLTLTINGTNNPFLLSDNCTIGAVGSQTSTTYIVFKLSNHVASAPLKGEVSSGTITLSNGAELLFTMTWR